MRAVVGRPFSKYLRNVMANNQEVAVSETVDGSAALAVLEPSSVEVYEEARLSGFRYFF